MSVKESRRPVESATIQQCTGRLKKYDLTRKRKKV